MVNESEKSKANSKSADARSEATSADVVKEKQSVSVVQPKILKPLGLTKDKSAKVNVYGIDGKVIKQVELPHIFFTEFRPDIIRKAVVALQTHARQPYAPAPTAGMRHAVFWWGKGRGVSRVPRLTGGRRGAQSPGCVGGRRAHPPKVEKVWFKAINEKEKRLAICSALAATSQKPIVKARGHKFEEDLTLPIVMEDKLQSLKKTREVMDALNNLGVLSDLIRAEDGIAVRAGRGKMRGRRYKTPISVLLVVAKDDGLKEAARNLPGVSITTVPNLNAEILAPGGMPGRLTIFSESALSMLEGW
ncbi:MAG: 50S ribosomal protein L4 [Thermoplasmata archaeon]